MSTVIEGLPGDKIAAMRVVEDGKRQRRTLGVKRQRTGSLTPGNGDPDACVSIRESLARLMPEVIPEVMPDVRGDRTLAVDVLY